MSNKININRPFVKREDITERKNFQKVLLDYKKASTPIYKTSRFYGAMSLAAVVVSVVVYFAFFRVSEVTQPRSNEITNSNIDSVKLFVNPPLTGLAKRYTMFKIDASAGGEIKYETGSSIKIPAGCFVDAKGNPVKGNVDIQYREFHDAVDFFLSGIPMTYDSGGIQYTFESAGMMDMQGFQNDEPVFVSRDKNIAVSMASKFNGSKYNLYFLDTINRNWSYKGKDIIQEGKYPADSLTSALSPQQQQYSILDEKDTSANKFYSEKTIALKNDLKKIEKEISVIEKSKPIEPKKGTPNLSHFTIEVDTAEFPEIAGYSKVIFEIGDENKTFNSDAYKIAYDDVKLQENNKGVSYKLILSKGGKKSTYIVYPVYDEKDITGARKDYDKKFAAYQNRLAQRKADEIKKQKEFEAQLKKMEEDRATAIKQEQLQQESAIRSYQASSKTSGLVYRTFMINGFGTYNCDNPQSLPHGASVVAAFTDEKGNKLNFNNVYLVDKGRNALFNYYYQNEINLKFDPQQANILWTVTSDNKIAVFTEEDFKSINTTTGPCTFKMKVSNSGFKNENEVRRFLSI